MRLRRRHYRLKQLVKRLLFPVLSLIAASSAALAAGGGGHQPGDPIHINWWTWDTHAPPMGWFIINFVMFVGLLVFFAKGPLRKALEARHERIKNTIEQNQARLDKAQSFYEETKQKLANMDADIQGLLQKMKEDAEQERHRLVDTANEYADRLRSDSSTILNNEVGRAKRRLRDHVVADALRLSEEKLRAELDDKKHAQLIEEAIAQLENGAEIKVQGASGASGGAGGGQSDTKPAEKSSERAASELGGAA